MSYSIHITATAERDILRAADYIEFTLKNPTAAEHLLDAATKQINSLSDMPEKYYLVDDPDSFNLINSKVFIFFYF